MGKLLDSFNENGWTKGHYVDYIGRRCLVGHIRHVYKAERWEEIPAPVLEALVEAIPYPYWLPYTSRMMLYLCTSASHKPAQLVEVVTTFNDHPSTTEEQCRDIAKYADELIEVWENEHGPINPVREIL